MSVGAKLDKVLVAEPSLRMCKELKSCKPMQVRDVMRTKVMSVNVGTSAKAAFGIMRRGRFRHLPVLALRGKVAGVVSDRDLRNVVVIYTDPDTGAEDFFVSADTSVDKLMATDPVSVAPDDDVATAIKLIRDLRIGCLIVSENDHLVGILSYVDLLDMLLNLLNVPDQEIST